MPRSGSHQHNHSSKAILPQASVYTHTPGAMSVPQKLKSLAMSNGGVAGPNTSTRDAPQNDVEKQETSLLVSKTSSWKERKKNCVIEQSSTKDSIIVDTTVASPAASSSTSTQRKYYYWVWMFLLLVLLVTVLTLGCVKVFPQMKENNSPSSNEEEAVKDSYDREGYYEKLLQMFQHLPLLEPNSPQGQALEWLGFEDFPIEDIETSRLWQRFALVVWYYSQGGPQLWTLMNKDPSSGWIEHGPGVHECDWKGVDCDTKMQVIGLRLGGGAGNALTGTSLSTELGLLTSLMHFDVSNQRLQGTMPSEWKALTKLVTLNLANNQLSSTLPSWMGQFSELRALILEGNLWTGQLPSTLQGLEKLERLELQNNLNLQGALEQILTSMSDLEYLDISMTEIGGSFPSNDVSLSNLKVLRAWSTPLTGTIPTHMGTWSNLQKLDIGQVPMLTGTLPSELSLLTHLDSLVINHASNMEGTLPTEFGLMTNLTTMELRWTNRQGTLPKEYSMLTNLARIDLAHNPSITGTIPSEYGRIANLDSLYLYGTKLTGTVGPEICGLDLTEFETDCKRDKIICDCCTDCQNNP